jgi:acyl-CoA thioesterase II
MTSAVPQTFLELMTLERVASDFFIGQTPQYPWGRVFGGQVVAQALAAASATVDKPHQVHSLHAYFVLGGTPGEQILYEVDRLREGRSFTTRRVVARQSGGAILNLDASFHAREEDIDIQEGGLPDGVPLPPDVAPIEWGAMAQVREIPPTPGVARSQVWMRVAEALDQDQTLPTAALHACALAYMSDHNPMDSMVLSHPKGTNAWEEMMTASLDHSIWFHRPIDATDWILFDMQGHGLVNARGMATGSAYSTSGIHLATIAQEGLVRSPRPKPVG